VDGGLVQEVLGTLGRSVRTVFQYWSLCACPPISFGLAPQLGEKDGVFIYALGGELPEEIEPSTDVNGEYSILALTLRKAGRSGSQTFGGTACAVTSGEDAADSPKSIFASLEAGQLLPERNSPASLLAPALIERSQKSPLGVSVAVLMLHSAVNLLECSHARSLSENVKTEKVLD
jgi:hypothetical protein